jgi:predicted transcriptional regulator
MHIELPPDLAPFVEQEFATGRYATREDVVVQALCLLRDERQAAIAGIKQGLEDASAGRTQPLGEALTDIRNEFSVRDTQ